MFTVCVSVCVCVCVCVSLVVGDGFLAQSLHLKSHQRCSAGIRSWLSLSLEVPIRRWVHCSHKEMDMVSNNTLVGCAI